VSETLIITVTSGVVTPTASRGVLGQLETGVEKAIAGSRGGEAEATKHVHAQHSSTEPIRRAGHFVAFQGGSLGRKPTNGGLPFPVHTAVRSHHHRQHTTQVDVTLL
jgi:hypothetical protein